MPIQKDLKKDLKEDPRFKKELKILNSLFKDIEKNRKSLVNKLVENAAFLGVLLDDLQQDIKENGYKDFYQNGQHQHGVKRSVSADLYQVALKNYNTIIKELVNLLPEGDDPEADIFEDFVHNR